MNLTHIRKRSIFLSLNLSFHLKCIVIRMKCVTMHIQMLFGSVLLESFWNSFQWLSTLSKWRGAHRSRENKRDDERGQIYYPFDTCWHFSIRQQNYHIRCIKCYCQCELLPHLCRSCKYLICDSIPVFGYACVAFMCVCECECLCVDEE